MRIVVRLPMLLLEGDGWAQLGAMLGALKGAIPVERAGYSYSPTGSSFSVISADLEVSMVQDSALSLPTAIASMGASDGKD